MRTFCCSVILAVGICFFVHSAFAKDQVKGIGDVVHEAAKSGLRGKALAEEIKRLQAAKGIGQLNGENPQTGRGPGAKGGGPPAGKGHGAKGGGPPDKGEPIDEADIVERDLEAFIELDERRREALVEALETAPDSAKPGIQRAIDESNEDLKNSRELLRRLREHDGGPGAKGGGPPAGKGPGAKGGGPPEGKGPGGKGKRNF